jgi:hypothetical protein
MATAQLREAWSPKDLPILYKKGHLRTKSQICYCVLADLSDFEDDLTLRSILAAIIESAFCIFFCLFQTNDFDKSTVAILLSV